MDAWSLPTSVELGGKQYAVRADFRAVLRVLQELDNVDEPVLIRWRVALGLFYEDYKAIPAELEQEAMERLAEFINCGRAEESKPAPKLIDWEQDALTIVADVNKVAGCEIRAEPFLHWWTFMALFNGIGEGQLSMIVSIRDKLRRGKPLEKWEQQFYQENKDRVQLQTKYTAEEQAERDRLEAILSGTSK